MSHLGRIDRDLAIPPRPMQISMAGDAWACPPTPRGAPLRPRPGPVQEAYSVGFVAPCTTAEAAFLLWG